uniref:Integrase catalytic domain-containing protein n=1 Tax=Strongyloides venezuelensis TaxID=75913 RepID=A0A0K0FSZ4_STRVS
MTDTLEYIGLQISPRGISIPDSKKAKFLNFSRPKSLKQLMFFCNFLNYYRSMIPEFSVLLEYFYSIKSFKWLDAEESHFKRILEILSQDTYLISERAVSSALYWHKDSNSGLFDQAGRTLSSSESNYLSQTKILLAAKEIMYDNYKFIFDIPIRILINDSSLKSVLTKANEPTSAQTAFQRFRLFLECYNVEHIFTKTVDMFNKLRIENHFDESTPICALRELVKDNALESIEVSDIVRSYISDFPATLFCKVVANQDISDIELKQLSFSLRQYINTDSISIDSDGLIKINNKIYIPSSYEDDLLKLLHRYHRSASAMISLCKSQFILENYSTKINNYHQSCSICMMYRRSGPRKISTWPSCSEPRQRWHCDYLYFRNKYLLVITDVFSNFLILYHLPSLSASTLREAFNCIFAQYGKPTILVLDNHPSFAAKEIKQYFLSHSIFIIYAIKYQHHSNGYAENMVGYTKASLTKLIVTENFKSAVNLTMLKNHSSPFHDSTPEKLFFKDNNLASEIILRHTPDIKIINQRGMFKIKPEEKLWKPCLVEQKLGSDTFLVTDDNSSTYLFKSNCVNLNIGPVLK